MPRASTIVAPEPTADRFWPRLGEFLVLYAVLPAVLYLARVPGLLIPGLVAGAIACAGVLWRDPTFERRRLWGGVGSIRAHARSILVLFAFGGVSMIVALALTQPGSLLDLPRRNLPLWGIIMLFYPLVSVYPQEVIYRAFLMHRYRDVFHTPATMIAASASAFAFGHIIFDNALAVVLTLVGGLLFAWRYHSSRALLPTSIEHALYGQLIFTIGLGESFYMGGVR